MSRKRIQFDRDAVPKTERANPHASASFDWDEACRQCDGEIGQAMDGLSDEAKAELSSALIRILAWVYAVKGYHSKSVRVDAAIGRRAIAMGLHVCPTLVPAKSRAEAARIVGIKRQNMVKLVKKAERSFPL